MGGSETLLGIWVPAVVRVRGVVGLWAGAAKGESANA
jgi:hypothetical protein